MESGVRSLVSGLGVIRHPNVVGHSMQLESVMNMYVVVTRLAGLGKGSV